MRKERDCKQRYVVGDDLFDMNLVKTVLKTIDVHIRLNYLLPRYISIFCRM